MITLESLEQGSAEGLALRKTKITATDSASILGLNPWKSELDLWREKTGLKDPDAVNEKMLKGTRLEPIARQRYCEVSGMEYTPIVALCESRSWQMASLDGISETGQTLLEIKCGGRKLYEGAKRGIIPEYYICQVQHQLAVTEVDQAIFYVYYEEKDVFVDDVVLTIDRNDVFINEMNEREFEFWRSLGCT